MGDVNEGAGRPSPRRVKKSGKSAAARLAEYRQAVRRFRLRLAAASAGVLVLGVATGLLIPRGPVSGAQAVAVMASCAAAGFLVGLYTRAGRAVVLSLLAYAVGVEVARAGVPGLSASGLNVSSAWGIYAFITGRGFHGLVAFAPLVVAGAAGVGVGQRWRPLAQPTPPGAVARRAVRRGPAPTWRWISGVTTALAGAVLVVVAVLLLRPASTPAIAGADGRPLPGSVAEITQVEVNGHRLSVLLRGRSAAAPVLLYLAGGPGASDMGAVRVCAGVLEDAFVVAVPDARGAGKSFAALDPVDTLTIEGQVDDAIALAEWLRRRFDEPRVYLVANSWGTLVAALAAERRPDLFWAYVGTGQMVSTTATDRGLYEQTLAWARRHGEKKTVQRLEEYGPPPYDDPLKYAVLFLHERDWNKYPRREPYASRGEMPYSLTVPEYTLAERARAMSAFVDSFMFLYPQSRDLDLRREVTRLAVPVYLVSGHYEAGPRRQPARQWFDALEAPEKDWAVFPQSGHRPLLEEPERFLHYLQRTVLPATYPGYGE